MPEIDNSINHKYIVYGGPDPENINEGCKSLGELIIRRLKENGDNIALVDGVFATEITYTELLEKSVKLAKRLIQFGLKKDDVVGLTSENRLDFPVVYFAAIYLGCALAPINLTYTEREYNHAINLSKPKIIFTSIYAADKVVAVAAQNSFVQKVILFGDDNPFDNSVILFDDFVSTVGNNVNVNDFRATDVDINDQVALIMCSSGTTGLPKGVMLTHSNIMVCVASNKENSLIVKFKTENMTILGIIPWFHAFGCLTLTTVICNSYKMVLLPKFEEGLFLGAIENYKVTTMFMVPPLMVFLAKHPLVDNYDLSSLRIILCGAAPLSKELEDAVRARIGVEVIRQGYGMSETTLGVLQQVSDVTKDGSVGQVMQGTWAKIIDPDTNEILGPYKRGELCVKGSQIMKGYIGNDAATKECIDGDGWLHTGDVAYYDDDRDFFIVDRLKELIKYKAYQVPPAELEAILLTNPKIKDAAVVGQPDEACGELPVAFIVKQADVDVTEEEIKKFVADRTSPAKRLHGGVRFIDEIPKNLSGKILRRELRTLLAKPKSKL